MNFKSVLKLLPLVVALLFGIYLGTTKFKLSDLINVQKSVGVGLSMTPNILDGDKIRCVGGLLVKNSLKRGDIIVFMHPDDIENEDVQMAKRIIGLEGDTVEIIDKEVFINGELLIEDYEIIPDWDGMPNVEPTLIGEGEAFVLGDNRKHSLDSRYPDFGLVDLDKFVCRIR